MAVILPQALRGRILLDEILSDAKIESLLCETRTYLVNVPIPCYTYVRMLLITCKCKTSENDVDVFSPELVSRSFFQIAFLFAQMPSVCFLPPLLNVLDST